MRIAYPPAVLEFSGILFRHSHPNERRAGDAEHPWPGFLARNWLSDDQPSSVSVPISRPAADLRREHRHARAQRTRSAPRDLAVRWSLRDLAATHPRKRAEAR